MTQLTLSHSLVAGTVENINDVQDNFDDIATWANGNIGTDNIATDGVGTAEIAPLAVGSSELASDAVTQAKVADSAIGPAELTVLPAALVYNSTTQSVSHNTLTALAFDTERFDTNSIHSTSANTSRLTCVTAGVYSIWGQLKMSMGGGQLITSARLELVVNGSVVIAQDERYPGLTTTYASISAPASLTASDYVQLQVLHLSSAPATATIAASDGANVRYGCEFGMAFLSRAS